jgi:hypothetical protein
MVGKAGGIRCGARPTKEVNHWKINQDERRFTREIKKSLIDNFSFEVKLVLV